MPMSFDHESSHESDDEIDLSHFWNVRINVDFSVLDIDDDHLQHVIYNLFSATI